MLGRSCHTIADSDHWLEKNRASLFEFPMATSKAEDTKPYILQFTNWIALSLAITSIRAIQCLPAPLRCHEKASNDHRGGFVVIWGRTEGKSVPKASIN